METTFLTTILFFGGLGFKEILVLAIIVLLLFGGKKIPELMKGLGTGIKEFKNSVKEDEKKPSEDEKPNS
ncbi:MAG: twin-arginine translocase TatA/TatE family subunit [Cloacibacterium sp.]|jgi:sec-independent protein translocase protein TatA|nr:twin-arginine translocase TatA/TatE family subunit [Cloacibacterium sp.]